MSSNPKKKSNTSQNSYSRFKQLDGSHSFKDAVPGAFVDYKVRTRHGGNVVFFNFELAKEMGLIPKGHDNKLNKQLEKMILETFAIVIINEYDEINNIKFPKKDIKPKKFMATRYLQLQHPGSTGLTSGDGRSIWNGEVVYKGKTWDVSSCGTGATCLSPATSKYNKYFQTGDPSISYGCGYSETDEGISTLFFSEIFSRNKIKSERVLAVIEFEKGIAITVRAYENLFRPSHFFNHLKQGNIESLENITDYYINRQEKSGDWKGVPKKKTERYKFFLDRMVEYFSHITARFEDDYIFCWLDWDGDNILMDGGIIDFGSIRQFGLFHHEYRYDDVERFSTSIVEQKKKSRYLVQTFAQMVDYLITGKKKSISAFDKHKAVKDFDKMFEFYKDKNLLYKVGFTHDQAAYLIEKKKNHVRAFRKVFTHFETAKSSKGLYKVADGITWDAIFCMRDILRELPQLLLLNYNPIENDDFIEIIKSSYANKKDLELNSYRKRMISEFQSTYMKLIEDMVSHTNKSINSVLLQMTMRTSVINKYDRVTGDSITHIVDKVLKTRPKLTPEEIFELMVEFAEYQHLDPDKKKIKQELSKREKNLMKSFFKIVKDCREGL
jgi:hypothetical protein